MWIMLNRRTLSVLTAVVSCLNGGGALAQDTAIKPDLKSRATVVVTLGTGTPNADPDRSGPATAIVVGDTPFLVDCGPGVVRRSAAAKKNGVDALRVSNLKHLFITHLHSDHTVGLADLIFTPWVLERMEPLQVYGPPGTKKMVDHIIAAYSEDIAIRRHGLEGANVAGYRVDVHEIKPGVVFDQNGVKVRAFQVNHGSWKHAYGYRFETPNRVVVVSGDTAPSPNLIANARGCDVLVHEVYSTAGYATRPPKWQTYHASFHTSSVELAEIANHIKPKLLVLTHQLLWGRSEKDLLKEIRARYTGEVVSADDLDFY
jgi:ribonuclease BN (tRNA processing enzyme)